MRPTLLILDDDPDFLSACDASLSSRFTIISARSVQEASIIFQLRKFAAVIVDYCLGTETADTFLDLIKQSEIGAPHAATPCIVLAGSADTDLAIKMINRQVFGLLEKPVRFADLIATVERAIGPMTISRPGGVILVKIEVEQRTVTCGGITTKLTPSEIKIFTLLIDAAGKTVGRDVFIRELWGRVSVGRSALDTHILNLKKKLPLVEPHLHAIYGAGYLLDKRYVTVV